MAQHRFYFAKGKKKENQIAVGIRVYSLGRKELFNRPHSPVGHREALNSHRLQESLEERDVEFYPTFLRLFTRRDISQILQFSEMVKY